MDLKKEKKRRIIIKIEKGFRSWCVKWLYSNSRDFIMLAFYNDARNWIVRKEMMKNCTISRVDSEKLSCVHEASDFNGKLELLVF